MPIGVFAFGSILPDLMDRAFSFGSQQVWKEIHRTISHWPPVYLMLAVGGWVSGLDIVGWLALGGLVHCLTDMLTYYGIPIRTPFGKRFSLSLLRVGSLADYVFCFSPLIVGVVLLLFGLISVG